MIAGAFLVAAADKGNSGMNCRTSCPGREAKAFARSL